MGRQRQPAGADELTPSWPEACAGGSEHAALRRSGACAARCRSTAWASATRPRIVKVFWLDGQSRVYTLTARQPTVHLYGSADDKRGMGEIARAYLVLGVEHILSGFDHLLFVLALLFLVGFRRRLVWTITAFTLAHSLTLAQRALGWLTLRSPPVEATIALSIVLVAGEALHKRETLARRWPALVAFLFGLVHGLGFAGALKDIGLPQNHLATALLTFNVGVEIGQLLAVAVVWAAVASCCATLALARFAAARRCSTASVRWPRTGRGCASPRSSVRGAMGSRNSSLASLAARHRRGFFRHVVFREPTGRATRGARAATVAPRASRGTAGRRAAGVEPGTSTPRRRRMPSRN